MQRDQYNGRDGDAAHIAPLLETYHAGTLPAERVTTVERHLRVCPACQEESDAIALYRLIRAAPAPSVGPELRERVYARIAAESAPGAISPRTAGQPALSERSVQQGAGLPPHPHTPRPGRGWLSGAAAVIIVALLAGVLWGLPRVRNGASATNTPSPDSQTCASGSATKLPTNTYISDIAMATANEGWAVGEIFNSQGVATQALLLRFSACQLIRYTLDLPNVMLTSISMGSPNDGWAVGSNDPTTLAPVLLHYSSGAWKQVNLLRQAPAQATFVTIKMRTADEGWILVYYGAKNSSGLLHYVNGVWSSVTCPLTEFGDITPAGPNDLWVTGSDAGAPRFAHYHNGKWSVMPQPKGIWIGSLHAVSPIDIWASGANQSNLPVTAHYDGATWQVIPQAAPPGAGSFEPTYALGDGEGWAFQYTISTPIHQMIVTNVLRETGGQWQTLGWPYKDINLLHGWTPTSAGDVWLIGQRMHFLPTTNGSGENTQIGLGHDVLLHYANGTWTSYG